MRAIVIVLAIVPGLSFSQVYRCGSTYQSQPCEGGKKIEIQQVPEPDSKQARITCEAAERVMLKDPDSAKPEGEWRFARNTTLQGRSASMWLRYINAKNGYGGYEGAKPFICYTSPDGRELVAFRDH